MRVSNKSHRDYTDQKNKEQWREKKRKITDEQANAIKDKEREDKRKYEDAVRKNITKLSKILSSK